MVEVILNCKYDLALLSALRGTPQKANWELKEARQREIEPFSGSKSTQFESLFRSQLSHQGGKTLAAKGTLWRPTLVRYFGDTQCLFIGGGLITLRS